MPSQRTRAGREAMVGTVLTARADKTDRNDCMRAAMVVQLQGRG